MAVAAVVVMDSVRRTTEADDEREMSGWASKKVVGGVGVEVRGWREAGDDGV